MLKCEKDLSEDKDILDKINWLKKSDRGLLLRYVKERIADDLGILWIILLASAYCIPVALLLTGFEMFAVTLGTMVYNSNIKREKEHYKNSLFVKAGNSYIQDSDDEETINILVKEEKEMDNVGNNLIAFYNKTADVIESSESIKLYRNKTSDAIISIYGSIISSSCDEKINHEKEKDIFENIAQDIVNEEKPTLILKRSKR